MGQERGGGGGGGPTHPHKYRVRLGWVWVRGVNCTVPALGDAPAGTQKSFHVTVGYSNW